MMQTRSGIIAAAAAAPIVARFDFPLYENFSLLPTTVWPFHSHDVCISSEPMPFPRC